MGARRKVATVATARVPSPAQSRGAGAVRADHTGTSDMPYTLLLGETEPHVRHMMAFKLRQAGYAVLVAEDGDAVLEMAKHLAPAAVIIDARLTRGDGTPLHRALASSESTIDLPLVLLVADESEVSEADRAVERLMRILTKPVGPTEVLKALGGMLTPLSAVTGRNSADVAFKRFAI